MQNNNILKFVVCLFLVLPFLSAVPWQGSGNSTDPYQVTTCLELEQIGSELNYDYILMNDIECNDTISWDTAKGFKPIGNNTINFYFSGNFNGVEYSINNLHINRTSENYVGLFGYSNGTLKNINLINFSIKGSSFAGGLIGDNRGNIENITVNGIIFGVGSIGGLVGYNNGTILNGSSRVNVTASSFAGGFVGDNNNTITNSYATGNVTATSGSGIRIGGFVGGNFHYIGNSYATGNVSGIDSVGGFAGHNNLPGGGGDFSRSKGTINNSYSTGSISANPVISGGGFVGCDEHDITCVMGAYGDTNNCFWDVNTSNQTISMGGVGKTTLEMKDVRTFTDYLFNLNLSIAWDFVGNQYNDTLNESIWNINSSINEGYPSFLLASIVSNFSLSISLLTPSNHHTFDHSNNLEISFLPISANPLSTCSLYEDFTGSWNKNYTWTSPSNGSSNNHFVSLPDGSYRWYIKCNDTFGGNTTSFISYFNVVIPIPSGGGSGGITQNQTQNIITGNAVVSTGQPVLTSGNWTIQSELGGNTYQFNMIQNSSRTRDLLFENLGTNVRTISLSCVSVSGPEDLCEGVKFENETFSLIVQKTVKVSDGFTISIPSSFPKGTYVINLVAEDESGNIGVITVQVKITSSASITGAVTKLFSSTSYGVPYVLFFFLVAFLTGVMAHFIIFKPNKLPGGLSVLTGLVLGFGFLLLPI